ncbi:uncharacterized protein MYCFIDRAFT_216594 [Pseudocercospora fijiensis CIRAD86]|uniref:Uncharacterized protein n=1 Tax=Pseudocercospora fijiensis (strain CIRAD86) TaxID=383855 RepID=M3A1M8_PSEFD|nr:uncharacterized protein MYCFIDRAFT_216594 [Pseudocercospora fijiensis CIRAD86]EME78271.1 hypothetical protein MYCFIDRAFT_216594 [Pseudocercospora fijiensis CIRAD86]
MPRTLPWLGEGAKKKVASAPAAPRRKRTASPSDLVNSDLDDLDDEPKPKKRKQAVREPSSSPPPLARGPPPTVYMNEGLAGDDMFMMVEDEFYSTAQLFTRHLHYEEYELLKKKHKSRGREMLANLQRGTDNGRTQQSKQLRLRLEAEETRKKQAELRRRAGDSSDEDEYMEDPQLAGLMTGGQVNAGQNLAKLAQARSNNSLQSPAMPIRTRDALAVESSTRLRTASTFAPIEEADEDEDEDTDDSDDLDIKPTKMQRAYNQWANNPASETTFPSIEKSDTVDPDSPPRVTTNRNQFSDRASPAHKSTMLFNPRSPARAADSPIRVKVEEQISPIRPIKREKKYRSFFDDEPPEPSRIVQIKAEKSDHVKKEAEKRKEIEDSIPTFLF